MSETGLGLEAWGLGLELSVSVTSGAASRGMVGIIFMYQDLLRVRADCLGGGRGWWMEMSPRSLTGATYEGVCGCARRVEPDDYLVRCKNPRLSHELCKHLCAPPSHVPQTQRVSGLTFYQLTWRADGAVYDVISEHELWEHPRI